MVNYYTVEACSSSNAYKIRFTNSLNMKKAIKPLSSLGTILAETPIVIIVKSEKANMSVYASGRIMLKNITYNQALELAKQINELFEEYGVYES